MNGERKTRSPIIHVTMRARVAVCVGQKINIAYGMSGELTFFEIFYKINNNRIAFVFQRMFMRKVRVITIIESRDAIRLTASLRACNATNLRAEMKKTTYI